MTPEVKIVNGTKLMVESVLKEVSEGQVGRLVIDLYSIPTNTDAALLSQAIIKVEICAIWVGQPGQLGQPTLWEGRAARRGARPTRPEGYAQVAVREARKSG